MLLRFGDLVLKGRNKPVFVKKLRQTVERKLKDLHVAFDFQHDRFYIHLKTNNEKQVISILDTIAGIQSYSFIHTTIKDFDAIAALAIEVIKSEIKLPATFKVESKRADKTFESTSQEISKIIAAKVLPHIDGLGVDVKNPDHVLSIEIRKEAAYLYIGQIKGMGGYPIGVGGKGLVMMSGGIDSPVAAYLTMKQGVEVDLMHFESTPLTPLESVQKVIDLAKVLSRYTPKYKIKLHLVPFLTIHESILKNIPDPYIITIIRRMMYQIAQKYSEKRDLLCLINGESIGQVASQTLDSMKVVEHVTTMPILRPVITNDKQEIINISKKIGAFDISIRPFNDCCSVYVPKNPVIHPTIEVAQKYEEKLQVDQLINQAIEQTYTLIIKPDTNLELSLHGFEVKEALEEARKMNVI